MPTLPTTRIHVPWTINEVHGTDARTQFMALDGRLIFEIWDAITDEEARLIASAPKLLADLVELADLAEGQEAAILVLQGKDPHGRTSRDSRITAARATIATVKGR